MGVRSSTVRDPDGNFLYGVRVVQDITERKEAEERQKLLIDELNHRVKNTLATVQSLATQTARGTDFAGGIPRGVRGPADRAEPGPRPADAAALDAARTFATSSADRPRPICRARTQQFRIDGEAITLTPRVALTLALALHELTTNASKYGALSVAEGRIEIRWRVEPRPGKPSLLRIEWRERGGPPVEAPERSRLRLALHQGSVATEL